MSGLLGLTPTLRVVLRNPLLGKRYPEGGEALAVVDTGYEGFIALPWEVFSALSLRAPSGGEKARPRKRRDPERQGMLRSV